MSMARVWKYGDHVNTDLIIPGRYLDDYDIISLSKHAMEDIDPSFVNAVAEGDVIVSGRNFGCGSSREQAPAVLKEKGVGAVFASSIARIFYRNAINVGLPVIISEEAVKILDAGDEVEFDLKSGTLTRKADGVKIDFEPLPPFLLEILESGGLVRYMKRKLVI
jgi:3-isopropylmalate/(R)-2-methylmalate dehydratase small subunit